MSKFVVPVVLNDEGTLHKPMGEDQAFNPASIPLSPNQQNLLGRDEDGIALLAKNIVRDLDGNPLVVDKEGKIVFDTAANISAEDKVLSAQDNRMTATLSLSFDVETQILKLLGKSNEEVAEVSLPVGGGFPTVVEILQDFTPPAPPGYEESPYPQGTYLHMRFQLSNGEENDLYVNMGKLVDIYTGGAGIDITDNVVSVKVAPGDDNALSLTEGELFVQKGLDQNKLGEGLKLDDDGKLVLDFDKIAEVLAGKLPFGVSADVDNALSEGSDGKPYFPGDAGSL